LNNCADNFSLLEVWNVTHSFVEIPFGIILFIMLKKLSSCLWLYRSS
jgi:hypothetical protein